MHFEMKCTLVCLKTLLAAASWPFSSWGRTGCSGLWLRTTGRQAGVRKDTKDATRMHSCTPMIELDFSGVMRHKCILTHIKYWNSLTHSVHFYKGINMSLNINILAILLFKTLFVPKNCKTFHYKLLSLRTKFCMAFSYESDSNI